MSEQTSGSDTGQDALQDFLQVVSHDLGEPLRQVISFGEILEDEEHERLSESGREYLHAMIGAGVRMRAMLDGVLQLARVSSRAQPFAPCDLNHERDAALLFLESDIRRRQATLNLSPLPSVVGDALQMRQLLRQLIENAIKFAKPGEPPVIRIAEQPSSDPAWIEWVVEDEGIGIDPRYQQVIFDVFQRLNASEAYPGVGVGLTICQRICERHGGQISAVGSEGQGLCMTVRLPQRAPPGAG